MIRFDTDLVVYQEALINGQYLVANTSAMGRPKTREWLWQALSGGAAATRPLRTRQHAFQIELDGQLLTDRWQWVDSMEVEPSRERSRELVIVLSHAQRSVQVEIHTRLDDTPHLTRWLVITNTGQRPSALSKVFPWSGQIWDAVGNPRNGPGLSGLTGGHFSLGRFADTTALTEGSYDWMTLPAGKYGIETNHGRSGWGMPFFVLRNDVTGEVLVCHFAWSGNWQVDFFNDYEPGRQPVDDAYLYLQVGMAGPAPLRVLAPGESASTPEVHMGFLFGDLDRCVQTLHEHQRRSMVLPAPTGKEHRVEVNHTGYTRNAQITESQLHEEIDVAADIGIELFMLDAGWFGDISDRWFEAVGDWDRESPLLPAGVNDAFDRIRERGMLCGLWVEAERMGSRSNLLRTHPDWQMVKRGERIPNLDLSEYCPDAP